jgi:nitrogen-specific signal transduction histidine kinase
VTGSGAITPSDIQTESPRAKKSVPERASIDINGAISEVLALTRQELQRSGITTRAELDPNLPPVLADRIQLQQLCSISS